MIFNMMTFQEVTTHADEIMKGWINYENIAIKDLQTENIIPNKNLLWEQKLPYEVSVTTLLNLSFPYSNNPSFG